MLLSPYPVPSGVVQLLFLKSTFFTLYAKQATLKRLAVSERV
jgi:hypothetical protein